MTDKTATVRKLLAKAERAGSEHEAEAFRAKATELMIKFSIDEAVLSAGDHSTDTLGSRRIVITGAYAKPLSSLLNQISIAFETKAIRIQSGSETVIMVYGWESDLDLVEVLFSSLQIQAMREAKMSHRANRHINGRSWTTSFVVGFAGRVGSRLKAQRVQAVKDTGDSTGTELAIFDRSRAVAVAFRTAHPRTTRAGGSRVGARTGYYSGQRAGDRADLGQGGLGGRRVALAR